ncbi:MAG: Gfo/Idh/MocA family oxidoreductase [Caldilinea sp.]|nr:Gfo/Idh/MocA family oxidoreductase [Caldilineaceae bacterium]MCB9116080.1 Gfo/Idh/MocA family oxidoreductase [Caldilineaceae bacterium]MCB9122296.1 Gfo/Idh/MocA family oxidoreductase [Caldilineaceae bacterium]MCO5211092.1 Gfo/Idh/MocA family oxidoreductase [Caldilinea sp.]MCW5842995.1 Gfo/Idh/MocA family oxidoreductase [Caldilinea sp.]
MSNDHPIKFVAIGLAHNHVYDMARRLMAAGAELVACWDDDPANLAAFAAAYPHAETTRFMDDLLADPAIDLVVSAAIHDERGALGVRAMQQGKDFLCTKPGFTTLEQLEAVRRAGATTGCRYTVYFGERVGNPATVLAGELVRGGAIGHVVHTAGFGPHRLFGRVERPAWVFQHARYGGILNDLASHQIDQFLYFTGSPSAEIVAATVANHHHRQFVEFEDFGEVLLRGEGATGFIRVDWLSPAGLDTWGDVRLFLLGTEGYMEVRKTWDVQGRAGTDHLFVVDGQGERHIQATGTPLPFMADYLADLRQRTETAITQAHVLQVSELALRAQAQAHILPASR